MNLVSVSAIDVFASALGVFIILTSVALPFIFNSSQSESRNADAAELEAEAKTASNPNDAIEDLISQILNLRSEIGRLRRLIEENQSEIAELEQRESKTTMLSELEESLASAEEKLKKAEERIEALAEQERSVELIPPIDLVIALDTTGSMTEQLRSLQGGIVYLSRILLRYSESPAVGIIEILDQCDYSSAIKFPLQELTGGSIRNLRSFVYSMGNGQTGCNRDVEEGVHLALRDAIAADWRSDAEKRVIVLISDFPPYSFAISEMKNSIRNFSKNENQTVSIVHPVSAYSTTQHVKLMQDLARLGKGEYIDGAGSIIGAIMLAL
ncbi:hypothetical protein OBB00_05330 [Gammaproteobacteria bacterium]|nr:hypothetical protein [Gammaproteobacteria bacterium]